MACTAHNPEFDRSGADADSHDLAVQSEDLAVPQDLAAADLSVPDLGPGDGSMPDLAAADAPAATGGDLAGAIDLRVGDLLVPCGDLLCAGCCVGGACRSFGQSCNGSQVCTTNGCQDCGNLSQPCCASRNCNGNLFCEAGLGTCGQCGRPGEKCCNTGACAAGGCCVSDTCVQSGKSCGSSKICLEGACADCGAAGQTCCANYACALAGSCCDPAARTCVSPAMPCGSGTCTAGSCGACGGVAIGCCGTPDAGAPDVCSASGTVCEKAGNDEVCAVCGSDGQSCCGANTCFAGGCCVSGVCKANGTLCSGSSQCVDSSCAGGTCGGLFQPCCSGNVCSAPDTVCGSGTCRACGNRDQICCRDPGSGATDFCEPPYVPLLDGTGVCHCRKP